MIAESPTTPFSWIQEGTSFLFDIHSKQIEPLKKILEQHNQSMPLDPNSCLSQVSTLHFLRFVIINTQSPTDPKWQLVLSSNYDGSFENHINELSQNASSFLESIFEHCSLYNPKTSLSLFLKRHYIKYSAFYCGTRSLSSLQIQKEASLRNHIIQFLHTSKNHLNNASPQIIFQSIKSFIATSKDFKWALEEPNNILPTPTILAHLFLFLDKLNNISKIIPLLLLSPLFLILLIPAIILWFILRQHEKKDSVGNYRNRSMANEFQYKPIHLVQNQLSNIVDIKPGKFRLYTLKFVLTSINFLAKYKFVNGFLGGIPSIHFARWVIIDDKKLLFFSNFDGSWENYLGDFVDKAAMGLTGVWSNTVLFPKTKNLIGTKQTGANDEEIFKLWARSIQVPTQFWFSAYPTLSTHNINNNSKIREGLLQDLGEDDAQNWLRRMI